MFPKRGAAALAVTTVALILLLSFKTPDQLVGNVNGSDERRGGRTECDGDGSRHRRPGTTTDSTTTTPTCGGDPDAHGRDRRPPMRPSPVRSSTRSSARCRSR